jgi:hypothetical protein
MGRHSLQPWQVGGALGMVLSNILEVVPYSNRIMFPLEVCRVWIQEPVAENLN